MSITDRAAESQERVERVAAALMAAAEDTAQQALTPDYRDGLLTGIMSGMLAGAGIGWLIWGTI